MVSCCSAGVEQMQAPQQTQGADALGMCRANTAIALHAVPQPALVACLNTRRTCMRPVCWVSGQRSFSRTRCKPSATAVLFTIEQPLRLKTGWTPYSLKGMGPVSLVTSCQVPAS